MLFQFFHAVRHHPQTRVLRYWNDRPRCLRKTDILYREFRAAHLVCLFFPLTEIGRMAGSLKTVIGF